MNNTIEQLLLRLRRSDIPTEVLMIAFEPDKYRVSLEERIIGEIVRGELVPLCSQRGGRPKLIPLTPQYLERTEEPAYDRAFGSYYKAGIYRIPDSELEGQTLQSAISVEPTATYIGGIGCSPMLNQPFGSMYGGTIQGQVTSVLRSRTYSDAFRKPEVELQGGNLVRIVPMIVTAGVSLRCTLSYDDEFTGLPSEAVKSLCELFLNVLKCYIYRKLIVQVDAQYMVGGQPVGVVKTVIEDFKNEFERQETCIQNFSAGVLLGKNFLTRLVMTML